MLPTCFAVVKTDYTNSQVSNTLCGSQNELTEHLQALYTFAIVRIKRWSWKCQSHSEKVLEVQLVAMQVYWTGPFHGQEILPCRKFCHSAFQKTTNSRDTATPLSSWTALHTSCSCSAGLCSTNPTIESSSVPVSLHMSSLSFWQNIVDSASWYI